MTNRVGAIAVVLLISACAHAGAMQSDAVRPGRLHQEIGPVNPERYRSVRDARDWQNPYLVIDADGIEVITKRPTASRKKIDLADLERTLLELPKGAWPYGRVAAVQDASIRPIPSDDRLIAANRRAAAAVLTKLDITFAGWPS